MNNPAFLEGKQAASNGKTLSDNPHVIGLTKLGAPRLSEDGIEWQAGFADFPRPSTAKEIADAARMSIHQFGRRYKRRDY